MIEKANDPAAFDTDVLIIGGGFGGLAAAIRIKEMSPETSVLLVDKQTIGWGGKANKGAEFCGSLRRVMMLMPLLIFT